MHIIEVRRTRWLISASELSEGRVGWFVRYSCAIFGYVRLKPSLVMEFDVLLLLGSIYVESCGGV